MSHLYERVALQLKEQIAKGVYRPGDRVPSVRRLSTQLRVSLSTVVEAYSRLESESVLEARPQSGYYVRARLWEPPAQPEMSRPATAPTLVSVGDLAMKILKTSTRADVMQFGVAAPHAQFLPIRPLNRALAGWLRRHPDSSAHYDFPPGCRELRVQIARRAADAGCTFGPDEIVTTSGCLEAVTLCLRAVAQPGDTIVIDSPAFYGTLQAIETLGMKALEIPTHPRDGISLDALRLALERWTVKACLLVPTFNNPLGACMPEANKRQLVKLLAEHDVPLIEDDIYGDLPFHGARPKTAKAFDRKGNVLLCSSFSKTLAPGYRVGWVAPGKYLAQVEHLKYVSTMATATLPQQAIAAFLARGGYDRYLRNVRAQYAQRVERTIHAIAKYFPEGTRSTHPEGGFVLWVELPEPVSALELHARALEKNISIAPGPLFSARGKYQNCIRLNCAQPWDDKLEWALLTLGRLTHSLT